MKIIKCDKKRRRRNQEMAKKTKEDDGLNEIKKLQKYAKKIQKKIVKTEIR